MPSDALHYSFVAKELNDLLAEGKIEKITMPEKDEIILGVRSRGKNHSLLISASASCPRCHLTRFQKENPITAPAFLMHLRKHIGGAKILSVNCQPYERVLKFELLTRNELAVEEHKTLIAEVMGKYSNIILVNGDGKISDCIKKVNLETSSKRQVLPNLRYLPAPPQDKTDIGDKETVRAVLRGFNGGNLSAYIIKSVRGLAPVSAEEAVLRSFDALDRPPLSDSEVERLITALCALYDRNNQKPCIRFFNGKPADFYIRPYKDLQGEYKFYTSLNEAMDDFFYDRDKAGRFGEKSHRLSSILKNAVTRGKKKLASFLEKRESCLDLERDKLFGELITANIYRLKSGMKNAELENWYEDGQSVTVPLDENKSPQANAQIYFKRYSKKKKTLEQLTPQIEKTEAELDYYDTIALSFSLCGENSEVDDLAAEMEQVGLIKSKNEKKRKSKPKPSSPLTVEYDGFVIRIGKNNVQNDELTKRAKADDVWLHTQKIHGSHVVISAEGRTVPHSVIEKAAAWAANFSKAAQSQNVPVDYTFIKYVNKPSGAPAGKVIYTHQSTIYVNPELPPSTVNNA